MATKLTAAFEAMSNKMASAMTALTTNMKTQSRNKGNENPEEMARQISSRDSQLYVKTGEVLKSYRQSDIQTQRETSTLVGKIKHQRVGQIVHQKIDKTQETQTTIRIRPKIPVKMSEVEIKRKKLLDQLNKIDQQLQDINRQAFQSNQNSASIKALQFVKKMNEERKKKQQKLILQNQKLKKARQQRQQFEKRKQQQLQKTLQRQRLQKQQKDKKWKEEIQRRKQLRQKDEVKKIALSIVSQLVQTIMNKDEPYLPPTLKLIRYAQNSQKKLMSLSVSRTVKRNPPEIVLKLDKEKHHYPMNVFREKILDEEKKRREVQRQIEEERSRLNELKRKYNKPGKLSSSMIQNEDTKRKSSEATLNANAIMLFENALKESDVRKSSRKQSRKQSRKMTESNQSMVKETITNESIKQSQRMHTQNNQSIVKDSKIKQNNESVKSVVQEIDKQPKNQMDYMSFIAQQQQKTKTQTSQDMEMQFFKASDPDPEVLQRVKQQLYEKQLFFQQFQLQLGDENADMRQMARQYQKSKGIPIQQLTQDDYVFNF